MLALKTLRLHLLDVTSSGSGSAMILKEVTKMTECVKLHEMFCLFVYLYIFKIEHEQVFLLANKRYILQKSFIKMLYGATL